MKGRVLAGGVGELEAHTPLAGGRVTCWRTAWQLPKEANVESRDLAVPRLRMRSGGLKTYCPHKAVNVHVHGDVIHNSQGGGNDPRVRYSLSVETR